MVKLYVKDNTTGKIHEYGTNPHDSLVLKEDGSIHYLNLQTCTGTRFPSEVIPSVWRTVVTHGKVQCVKYTVWKRF